MSLHRSRLLTELPRVLHGFTAKREDLPDFGNVSPAQGDPSTAVDNRAFFAAEIGVPPEHLTFSFQEHGTHVRMVKSRDRGAGALDMRTSLPPCDGLATAEAGVPLAVMTADCACILMADSLGRAVGAFHAGWRGVLAEMPARAVGCFREEYSIEPRDLTAWIGPTISVDHFEVGPEVWEPFHRKWGNRFLRESPPRIDLTGLIVHQLRESGVPLEAIEDCGVCTYADPACFSHRRNEKLNGRMMGVIGLKK